MAENDWLKDAPEEVRAIYRNLGLSDAGPGENPTKKRKTVKRKPAKPKAKRARRVTPRKKPAAKKKRAASRKKAKAKRKAPAKKKTTSAYSAAAKKFISERMADFVAGRMRLRGRGGKLGAVVTQPAQAKAIALSEARKKGLKVPAALARKNPLDLMIIGNPSNMSREKVKEMYQAFHEEAPDKVEKVYTLDGYEADRHGPLMVIGDIPKSALRTMFSYDVNQSSARAGRWHHNPGDLGRAYRKNRWKCAYWAADPRGYIHIAYQAPKEMKFVATHGMVG